MNNQLNQILSDVILTPLSYLYGFGVSVRNHCFEFGILKEKKFKVPVVVVGNIAVGGTGKTPHTEYIVNALCSRYRVGVLSRGYKRQTKGFVLASGNLSSADIGDEPYQMYLKFGDAVTLAVCEDRVKGIEEMLKIDPQINLFVLDDAFQHRYVKPKVSIALVEYKHPPYEDRLLPLGRLREPLHALLRADIVVVTKCPDDIKPMDIRLMMGKLNLYPSQKVFFSRVNYKEIAPAFPSQAKYKPQLEWLNSNDAILVFTGVANPLPLVKYLKTFKAKIKVIHFGDHHNFCRRDFELIDKTYKAMTGDRKFMVTTEKDMVRIINHPYFPHQLKSEIFYIPINAEFLPCEENFIEVLNEKINKQ